MNTLEETKSAAARFMNEHERIATELETAKLTIEDQRKELEKADANNAMLKEALSQANADKNLYLQYAFELASQLQFIVAGSARALMIAASIRAKIADQASGIPPVPGADIEELENIMSRISANADKSGDNSNGMMVDRDGKPIVASEATKSMQMPLVS